MLFKKTIVLLSLTKTLEKAVLDIERDKEEFFGTVRFFNLSNEPTGILTLAFLKNREVVKVGLSKKDHFLFSFHTEERLDSEKFTCALIETQNGVSTPMMIGTYDGKKAKTAEIQLASSLSLLDKKPSLEKTKTELDKNGIDFDEEETRAINDDISKAMTEEEFCEKNCKECQYRQAFFENDEKKVFAVKKQQSFFDEISEEINGLFEKFEPETSLSKIIPSSKWVRVDYQKNGNFYVVGLIYDNNVLKFVCYGVPGFYGEDPPKELEENVKFVPLDEKKPLELGWWLSFQDAESGQRVSVDIV